MQIEQPNLEAEKALHFLQSELDSINALVRANPGSGYDKWSFRRREYLAARLRLLDQEFVQLADESA